MVAHTTTTYLGGTALQSGGSCTSDPLPGGHAPPIPAHLHDRILSDLCHPGSSIVSVAHNNRISVSQLALWLTEPETREKMLSIERAGYAHTRMAASVTLASTVHVLHTIIKDYAQTHDHARTLDDAPRPTIAGSAFDRTRADEYASDHRRTFLPGEAILGQTSYAAQRLELRRAESVRRAAHHLYRLSRIVPVDDSILALAHAHRAAATSKPIAPADRTANVSERTSSLESSSSSPTVHPAGALQDLPIASSLKDDANSPAGALQDLPLAAGLKPDANSAARVSERTSSPGGTALQSGDASSRVPLVPGERSEPEPVLRDSPHRSVVIANDSEHANQASDANDTKTANSTNSQRVAEAPPRRVPGRMSLDELEAFAKAFDEQTRLDELADQLAEQQNADHAPPITPSRDPPL